MVSTINPKPCGIVAVTPVIVTVLPVPAPLGIVRVPELGVNAEATVLTDIRVPAPLFTSGLVAGKEASFCIGTKPPTSSTKSIILASIAAVVATLSSAADHVTPLAIVSEESCLRNKASASVSV